MRCQMSEDNTGSLPAAQPYVAPATAQWDPTGTLTVHGEDNPLPQATLGNIGQGIRVTGPAEFPLTILVQPVAARDLRGIDPTTVRIFRWDDQARTFRPVWRSGLNRG